jgi:LacI family transcriptional regulator
MPIPPKVARSINAKASKTKKPRCIHLILPLRIALGRNVLQGVAAYYEGREHAPFKLHDSSAKDLPPHAPPLPPDEPMLGAITPVLIEQRNPAQLGQVVNVMHRWASVPVFHVMTDDLRIGRMAADYFLGKNLRHFAYVGADTERLTGFSKRLREAGHPCDTLLLPDTAAVDIPGLYEWLVRLPKSTGIHTFNDRLARSVIEGLLAVGRAVPEDIAVVGVDDDFVQCLLSPVKITTIDPDFFQVGWQAAEMLGRLINGKTPPANPLLVAPGRLIERQSSDFPSIGDQHAIQAARLIRREATHGITVAEVIAQIPLSRRPLERRFRKTFGCSLHDQIQRDKLSEAVRLLAATSLTIGEIARRSGFSDAKQFSKTFRLKHKCTPSTYRRQQKKSSTPLLMI